MGLGFDFTVQLEEYVQLSAQYPERVIAGALNRSDHAKITKSLEEQMGYVHAAMNPSVFKTVFFFHNQQDATLGQLIIGGEYQRKEFK